MYALCYQFLFLLLLSSVEGSESACRRPVFSNGVHNATITVDGLNRTIQFYVPYVLRGDRKGANSLGPPDQKLPLLISFHGCNDHYPILDYHEEVTKTFSHVRDRTSKLNPWYAILVSCCAKPQYEVSMSI